MHILPNTAASTPTSSATTYDPTADTNAAGTSSASGGTLSQSDFLNLLSTQLQYQDPTNPESNTDFAAQMAQFSSLSEMNNLTSTMTNFAGVSQLSSGSSLIGQSVTTTATDSSGNAVNGTVTGALVYNSELYLTVNGLEVPYSSVTSVSAATASTGTTPITPTPLATSVTPVPSASLRHGL